MNPFHFRSFNSPSHSFALSKCTKIHFHSLFNITKKDLEKTTTAGFEPARAKPNRFLVCLLNHSDKFLLNHSDKLSRNLLPQISTSILYMTLE